MFRMLLLACAVELGLAAATLLNDTRHLGMPGNPEWSIFEGRTPDGTNLVLNFDGPGTPGAHTLFIRQDDVKQDWTVMLNGKRLGSLFLMEAPVVHALAAPAGLLKETGNRLEISSRAADDILIHEISLEAGSKAELLKDALEITVRERGSQRPFPCRITIEDERGHLAAVHEFGATNLAVRPGVVYTPDGKARIGLRPGNYTVFATRGPEFGVAKARVKTPDNARAELAVTREVNTRGWIAADTHMHTLTLSRHGDATLHERAITLAGEALDLAIVTEHNLHSDYAEAARDLGLQHAFTTVPGNEVTTKKGHFNIFPASVSAPPPNHTLEHWPDLFREIRKTPGVQVAIINHPTDVHSGFVPFAATNLDLATGRNLRGDFDFEFDGMELINSAAMNSDWRAPFRAWFALLNRGYRMIGVAASDSHDVSRFIVAQGRTYIRGDDSNPGAIDVNAACESLKKGRAVASLGLFATLWVREAESSEQPAGPGDLLSAAKDLEITARIEAPSWMQTAAVAEIYANGQLAASRQLRAGQRSFTFKTPRPRQDTYFALVAHGPGVTNQFWAMARPYQPSSKVWEPVAIGVANPVYVDADGDGKFSSPRDYAKRLAALPPEQARAKLEEFDGAVAAQFAELTQAPR